MDKSVITVTGGTGYIASWIVSDLLQEGHKVRITVRNKSDFLKYQHLLDLEGKTEGELSVFEADLLSPGSFDAAVKGADYVMHTASPFFLDDGGDPQKNLVDPAVKGTKNVLEAVNRSASVKRVVLTSSIAAIYGDSREMNDRGLASLDETIWNESSSLKRNAYSYSKTEAEKAAWEMVKKQAEWDLVTIHPGFVLGPSQTKRIDSTSIGTLLRILRGEIKSGAPDLRFIFSDVRDISRGHISAAFTESANGRYIIANESGNLLSIGKVIEAAHMGAYKVPKNLVPKWLVWLIAPTIGFTRQFAKDNIGYPLAADNRRSIQDLKLVYTPLKSTILDHVEQLKSDGLI
ncbi:NAD-dependent epimerase/dehydratase family protein [Oceanispirochaeta sp.]|jgi:nucleoside-diphosphate-sugar epimerase|uniref:NAD-dependent epimerase/dehydratase family protein n=1 Tax=Oceanispirochaeta sp. TaxID=2035350 RepID=UPI002627F49F|nr:NAD-dependent epimerase/dehydratase family protein [Oceanispirochaeta sp.]MDA3957341.1 NAD-dependent epimerase/dehydratase family protein [Oceanispirochaeta sp.]